MSSILIVEDERHLAEGLRFNLELDGYQVEVADTGEAALARLATGDDTFDLVVLDVMLPGVDGFTVAADLRQRGVFVPVLMLTARNRPEDQLRGFEAGADDYLPKPFELAIFLARIRSLLRRRLWLEKANGPAPPSTDPEPDVVEFTGKKIDFAGRQLWVNDRAVPLTLMEATLLRYLVRHQGKIVSRKALLEDVWGLREDTDTRAIDNFIVRLRRHIETDPTNPRHLLTVRGVGYRFVANPD